MRVFFFAVIFFITSVFTGCSKNKSIETSPTTPDASYTNDDARRDTFEDFGEPIDYPDEESPKIKGYYRLHYYHFV